MFPNTNRMQTSFRTSLTEAMMIVGTAAVLGFAYTAATGKGVFQPAPAPQSRAADVAPTFLTYEEAREIHLNGGALFIDARHAYDFDRGHISGAINIPLNEFDNAHQQLAAIPKDKTVVTYCDGAECNSSVELAKKLYAAGYSNVKIFFGGWNEWLSHNQATEQ